MFSQQILRTQNSQQGLFPQFINTFQISDLLLPNALPRQAVNRVRFGQAERPSPYPVRGFGRGDSREAMAGVGRGAGRGRKLFSQSRNNENVSPLRAFENEMPCTNRPRHKRRYNHADAFKASLALDKAITEIESKKRGLNIYAAPFVPKQSQQLNEKPACVSAAEPPTSTNTQQQSSSDDTISESALVCSGGAQQQPEVAITENKKTNKRSFEEADIEEVAVDQEPEYYIYDKTWTPPSPRKKMKKRTEPELQKTLMMKLMREGKERRRAILARLRRL